MWWYLTLLIPPAATFVIISFRRQASHRHRMATWNDLHKRGKILAEQLAHLQSIRDQAGEREGPSPATEIVHSAPRRLYARWPDRCATNRVQTSQPSPDASAAGT